MEMGKLTAKLRDAVPVCLLVEGKEIKRYKNIEIPDALKALEYKDFKFDVPLNGAITFKIMFEPGVLPEEFPQARERRTRKSLAQEAQPQETEPAEGVELQQLGEQPNEALPASVAEELTQALEDAQAAGEPVADIVEDAGAGQLIVITAEPEATKATAEAEAQPENSEPAKKPARKGKGKKGAALADSAEK